MRKSNGEGTSEFRAHPKQEVAIKAEQALTERREVPEISLKSELDGIKASIARIEKALEDIMFVVSRPHRQW